MTVYVLRWVDFEESGVVCVCASEALAKREAPTPLSWDEDGYACGERYDYEITAHELVTA